jgi:hypothetical protein
VNLKRPPIPDKTNLLPIFVARCEKMADTYALGDIALADAVDTLQDWAFTRGLVEQLGQDAVQAIMANAFAPDCLPREA